MAKAAFNKKKTHFTSKLDLNLRKKLLKCYIWSIALYDTEIWTLRTEGKIKGGMEVTRRRGRRRKKLLDDLKDRRGYSHLKGEALDRSMWRNRFGGGFGPVVRQNTE